jgi:hypothetical protein
VGPRAGLEGCGKSRPTGIRSPDRTAHRESLYRLSYPSTADTIPNRLHESSKLLNLRPSIYILMQETVMLIHDL